MGREDQRVGFGCVVHRPAARLPGGLRELAEHRVPVRLHDLQRMVHHVAPEQRLFAPGAEPDAGVVEAVPGAREKRETPATSVPSTTISLASPASITGSTLSS